MSNKFIKFHVFVYKCFGIQRVYGGLLNFSHNSAQIATRYIRFHIVVTGTPM